MTPVDAEQIAESLLRILDERDLNANSDTFLNVGQLMVLADELVLAPSSNAPTAAKFDEFSGLVGKLFTSCRTDQDLLNHTAAATLLRFTVAALNRYSALSNESPNFGSTTSAKQAALAQAFGLTRKGAARASRLDTQDVQMQCLSSGARAYGAVIEAVPKPGPKDYERAFKKAVGAGYTTYLEVAEADPNAASKRRARASIAKLLLEHGYSDR